MHTGSIAELLKRAADVSGPFPALLAPGRAPLSCAELLDQVDRTAGQLRAAGIGADDRVAVLLPNGPDLAVAFLAAAAAASCAPLNPAGTREQFEFYLRDLRARALLVQEGMRGPASEAAASLGIPVLGVRPCPAAGAFDLAGISPAGGAVDWTRPSATALLLHTSGTTARPKLVPLTGRNLTASASHVARTLALTPADRCLNIMPLFHVHGLVAAVLATLHAGASVVCTDGLYAVRFFDWMREFRPTWYTAVPTMHQALVALARAHARTIREVPLRFVRSSSAALPVAVLEELERVFGAPVVEAYGMTEASHQMASNPLPPARRKPGSVGIASGPEIAIMDAAGRRLGAGEIGEVVIRGPNVTSGYEGNDAATQAAFADGWFRTGDQGRLDEDGYLFLTGRLKELINRGGEKIAPREIDEALLAHPEVTQAVCFAVPHVQLGETVGAAVELRNGSTATAQTIRAWLEGRLPAFKQPRVIRIVAAIPQGPTGKLQRTGLAERLGIPPIDEAAPAAAFVPPRTPLESRIAGIWAGLLPGARIGVLDRFQALGGDSLLAATMLTAVGEAEGMSIGATRFVEEGTIASLAADVEGARKADPGPLVWLQEDGTGPPLYWLPGHESGLLGITALTHAAGGDAPALAFDFRRLPPAATLEALAASCVTVLRHRHPGPYHLAGSCFGGVVAFEMARQLHAAGDRVAFLALVDTIYPQWRADAGLRGVVRACSKQAVSKILRHAAMVRRKPFRNAIAYVRDRAGAFVRNHRQNAAARLGLERGHGVGNRALAVRYRGGPYSGAVLVVSVPGRRPAVPALGWRGLVRGPLEVVDLPIWFQGAMAEGNLRALASALRRRLATAVS